MRAIPRLFLAAGFWVVTGLVHGAVAPARTVADYARDLEAQDRAVRREAAYQLSRMGREARAALPQLVKALDDEQQQVWFGAISALANLGPEAEPALPALLKELSAWQPYRKDRQGAQALYRTALALGSIGPAAVPALSNALSANPWFVRAGAAMALGFAGEAARPTAGALMRLLEDEKPEVRQAASETLVGFGSATVPALTELILTAEEPRARIAAANTLRRLGTNGVAAATALRTAWAKEKDTEVRLALLPALVQSGMSPEESLALLRSAARDDVESVRQAALGLLVLRPVNQVLPGLLEDLRRGDAAARDLAVRLIAEIGPDARGAAGLLAEQLAAEQQRGLAPNPGLGRALAALGGPGVRPVFEELARRGSHGVSTNDWTLAVLRQVNALALPALLGGLTNPVPAVRAGALEGLAHLGLEARSAARRLPPLLNDPDAAVRALAWTAGARCGAAADPLVGRLDAALSDPAPEVRRAAVMAIGRLGTGAKAAVPRLIAELDQRDPDLRLHVVRALTALGSEAGPAVEALASRLETATPSFQLELLEAIGRIGVGAAVALPRMLPLAAAPEPAVRRAYAVAVGRLKQDAAPAAGALTNAVHDAVPAVRSAALRALAAVAPEGPGTVELAKAGLTDADEEVRRAAAAALGALEERGRPAEEQLFAMLANDGDRPAARDALRAIHPTSVAALMKALQHADWTVREMAADALARLGKGAQEAVTPLEKLVREDPQDEVKRASRRALRRIREG